MAQMETAEVTITDLHPATVALLLQYCYGCLHSMPSHHAEVPLSLPRTLCPLSIFRTKGVSICRLASSNAPCVILFGIARGVLVQTNCSPWQ